MNIFYAGNIPSSFETRRRSNLIVCRLSYEAGIMETDTGAHTVTATENTKSCCCHHSLNEPLNYPCAFIFTRTENILISIQKFIIKY